MTVVRGKDIIAIPHGYLQEFRRDPQDAMIRYGSMPQRARMPWFTNVAALDKVLTLPDQVTGATAQKVSPTSSSLSLEASPEEMHLLDGIAPGFYAWDDGYWHVHVDLALNKKRQGDAAGIAMGRIVDAYVERARDPLQNAYERVIRRYEVPLVAQIVAPHGDQIYIGSIVRLILQLKQVRHFRITSFSFDGFQSADAMQQLALAGLVTAGMKIEDTGDVTGIPKPFSVDGRSDMPYREVLEAVNEERIKLPRYELLRKELRELETVEPGSAPDHPFGGSKDTADPVAGTVGYLAAFGHATLGHPLANKTFLREDLERAGAVQPMPDDGFGVDDLESGWDAGVEPGHVSFVL